jgi:hypothetical protein
MKESKLLIKHIKSKETSTASYNERTYNRESVEHMHTYMCIYCCTKMGHDKKSTQLQTKSLSCCVPTFAPLTFQSKSKRFGH